MMVRVLCIIDKQKFMDIFWRSQEAIYLYIEQGWPMQQLPWRGPQK
jgi:hypothetical protein